MTLNAFKHNLHLILFYPQKCKSPALIKWGRVVQSVIYANILFFICLLFLETEPAFSQHKDTIDTISHINILVFLIEYVLRLLTIPKQKIYLLFRPLMVLDFMIIILYFASFFEGDVNFLRTLRLFVVFKLFKHRKFAFLTFVVGQIFKEKKDQFLFLCFTMFTLIMIVCPFVFMVENSAQPDVFTSMSDTLWWAFVTITTVGYGDMYPITGVGRVLATFVSILGVSFYTIPGLIFTDAFIKKMDTVKKLK